MRRNISVMPMAALCLVLGAADAIAQTYYLGLKGGYNHPHESEIEAAGPTLFDATLEPSGMAAAAFGFEWVDGWRFEGELAWRRSDFDSIDNVTISDGRMEIYAPMFNIYYGFRADAAVNPYLGAGAGLARLSIEDLAAGAATVDDFAGGPAWQGMAGVDIAVSESWKLSFEYRYFAVDKIKLVDSLGFPLKIDYQASAAMLGLRAGF
jgi:OOP family OmpA-OmpF porin